MIRSLNKYYTLLYDVPEKTRDLISSQTDGAVKQGFVQDRAVSKNQQKDTLEIEDIKAQRLKSRCKKNPSHEPVFPHKRLILHQTSIWKFP